MRISPRVCFVAVPVVALLLVSSLNFISFVQRDTPDLPYHSIEQRNATTTAPLESEQEHTPDGTETTAATATLKPTAAARPTAAVNPSGTCDYISNGEWQRGTSIDNETELRWVPSPSSPPCNGRSQYRRFDQAAALGCLQGKFVLLFGNSNTRTLYTALEALLKNQSQIPRLLAKQLCDNRQFNHSCWMVVDVPGYRPVQLHYWSYIKDTYDLSLEEKMGSQKNADLIIANTGINIVQVTPDGVWEGAHRRGIPNLVRFAASFNGSSSRFFWHTTTRICEHQPHFTRYKYREKNWGGRKLEVMNAALDRSNQIIVEGLKRHDAHHVVNLLDVASLVSYKATKATLRTHNFDLCAHYDDPLHHRFLDRELVQLILNHYCTGAS